MIYSRNKKQDDEARKRVIQNSNAMEKNIAEYLSPLELFPNYALTCKGTHQTVKNLLNDPNIREKMRLALYQQFYEQTNTQLYDLLKSYTHPEPKSMYQPIAFSVSDMKLKATTRLISEAKTTINQKFTLFTNDYDRYLKEFIPVVILFLLSIATLSISAKLNDNIAIKLIGVLIAAKAVVSAHEVIAPHFKSIEGSMKLRDFYDSFDNRMTSFVQKLDDNLPSLLQPSGIKR